MFTAVLIIRYPATLIHFQQVFDVSFFTPGDSTRKQILQLLQQKFTVAKKRNETFIGVGPD
jgi:hypothetical protein